MEELRQQIAEKGVPVFQLLAEKIGVTEGEIISMVSAGKIGADVVIEAFQNLEGPLARFRGGADRMGSSAGGLFARLKQEVIDLKMLFGDQLIPELKPLLDDAITAIKGMKDEAIAFGAKMAEVMGNIRATFRALGFSEILTLAALAFKKELLAGLDIAVRAGSALISTFADGTLGDALEAAAVRFKEEMILGVAEIARALSNILPDAAPFSGMRDNINASANLLRGEVMGMRVGRAGASAADSGPGFREQFAKYFASAVGGLGLSPAEQSQLDGLRERIARQRDRDRASAVGAPETPAPGGGGSTTTTAAPANPGGIVGGGLANALSRITGGGTIIMTRQLETMKKVQTAAEKTATAAEKTVAAVNGLSRKLGPAFG